MWFIDKSGEPVNSAKFYYFFVEEREGKFTVKGRCEFSSGETFVEVAKFGNRQTADSYLRNLAHTLGAVNVSMFP